MRRALLSALALLALAPPVALGVGAGGWNGQTPPNNPGYDGGEQNPLTGNCLHGEEWFMYSFVPKCTVAAKDPENASGMSIDQAWKQFSIGRPDVVFAYVEGGPNWHDPQFAAQLADQSYLNKAELPLPERADGASCAAYDCNGDGAFNVEDYANDPRVHKPYLNGRLTPEDLIQAFGDCEISERTHLIVKCVAGKHFDNDGDGYPNDIAGWNFLYNNNDPATSDSEYPHSDQQMERALAEANNGVGDVGICPGCQLLPIKAGHEALDTTDRIAQAVYFAVNSGASVIDLLTAELGYSDFSKAALQYAWDKGVVVIGASNDFDSADHQEGMFWPHEWPGNGLQPNDPSPPAGNLSNLVTSFRERSNETSFGPHALFSTPNEGGSTSESQPTQSGVALLVASEGRNAAEQGRIAGRLNAGEVAQVVRETASDIDDSSLGWPGVPGATFNIQYGYGRPNVLKADEAVAANRIPPVPNIDSPDWYALFNPAQTSSVPIKADISAPRATSFNWIVQYGLGSQPTEAQFHTIAAGHVNGHHLAGVLAHLNLGQIPKSFYDAPFHFTADLSSIEQYDVTIRIQATDARGLMGEDRRAIAVFHDPTLRAGFPRYIGQGKDSQPVLADLRGSGKLDVVFGDANGWVHALNPDTGAELPGWPAHTLAENLPDLHASAAGHAGVVPAHVYEPIESSPAVGDLLGNGGLDVVVSSTSGHLYAFDRQGHELTGFPKGIGLEASTFPVPVPNLPFTRPAMPGSFATPVLVPGMPGARTHLSILQAGLDGYLYAFDGHGRAVPGWPVNTDLPAADKKPPAGDDLIDDHKLVATPTLADLFGNGQREIVLRSQETWVDPQIDSELGVASQMFELAYWPNGNAHSGGPLVTGFPTRIQGVFDYYGSAQDAITEGVESASAAPLDGGRADQVIQTAGFLGPEYKLSGAGQSHSLTLPLGSVTALQNLIREPPSVVGTESVPTTTTAVAPVGFSESGTIAQFGGHLSYLAAGVDLSSMQALLHNGIAERITNYMRANDGASGASLQGFPAPMMGLAFLTAPAVADVDGDGQPDVISNDDSNNVAAFQQNGQPVPGFPKFTGGWTVWTPAVGDLDADGHNQVVDVTREGWLFEWNTPGKASVNQAYAWHQDNWHTGLYGLDTRPPLVPRDLHLVSPTRACWAAPGDDWAVGTAARYELVALSAPATPEDFARGRALGGAPTPAIAGTTQCANVPATAHYLGVRAIDHSGLIGMPASLPIAAACRRPTGRLRGTTLGAVKLGMTRARARSAFVSSSTRGTRYKDYFCLARIGIRVGFPSPALLKTLARAERQRVQGRVVLALTANRFYALRGVRPGETITAAAKVLRVGKRFHIGTNFWYMAPNGSSTAILKVRHGIVAEIGIANRRITQGRKAQRKFITSFG